MADIIQNTKGIYFDILSGKNPFCNTVSRQRHHIISGCSWMHVLAVKISRMCVCVCVSHLSKAAHQHLKGPASEKKDKMLRGLTRAWGNRHFFTNTSLVAFGTTLSQQSIGAGESRWWRRCGELVCEAFEADWALHRGIHKHHQPFFFFGLPRGNIDCKGSFGYQ